MQRDPAAVGLGDRLHDRESQPGATAVVRAAAALERLEQPVHRRRGPSPDPEFETRSIARPPSSPVRTSTWPPARLYRIPLSIRLPARRSSSRVSPRTRAGESCQRSATPEGAHVAGRGARRGGEVDALAPDHPALSARELHQPVEQLVHAVGRLEHAGPHLAQLADPRVGVGERDVGFRPYRGQRSAQLVARVGHEALLRLERARHRGQLPPREQPAQPGRHERGAAEREQVLERELALRRLRLRVGERAVQVAADQPVGHAQQQRRGHDQQPAVERGEPAAQAEPAHSR